MPTTQLIIEVDDVLLEQIRPAAGVETNDGVVLNVFLYLKSLVGNYQASQAANAAAAEARAQVDVAFEPLITQWSPPEPAQETVEEEETVEETEQQDSGAG